MASGSIEIFQRVHIDDELRIAEGEQGQHIQHLMESAALRAPQRWYHSSHIQVAVIASLVGVLVLLLLGVLLAWKVYGPAIIAFRRVAAVSKIQESQKAAHDDGDEEDDEDKTDDTADDEDIRRSLLNKKSN